MKRREFLGAGMIGTGAWIGGVAMAATGKSGDPGDTIVEAGIGELQAAMQGGG